jgi:hypothetical protein
LPSSCAGNGSEDSKSEAIQVLDSPGNVSTLWFSHEGLSPTDSSLDGSSQEKKS